MLKIPEELLLAEECSGDIFKKGQFKRGNILIPFVDYKFKRDSIKHIVTNPFIREENSMFELGIRELLWQNKMEDVHIFSLVFQSENTVNNKKLSGLLGGVKGGE